MINILTTRFHYQQGLLFGSASISQFVVLTHLLRDYDGRLRIRATLVDGGLLEFAEYIKLEDDNQIGNHAYSFHWQDVEHNLIRRWDNAKHHPQLPHAPHHIHWEDGSITGNPEIPTLDSVLRIIEQHMA